MRWLVMLMVVLGCGPSSKQVKLAKTAQYTASVDTIYDVALATAQENYNVTDADRAKARFITAPQLYSDKGARLVGASEDDRPEGAVRLQLRVEVTRAGDNQVKVTVKPRVVASGARARELADADLPAWAFERADELQLAIHDRAKGYTGTP